MDSDSDSAQQKQQQQAQEFEAMERVVSLLQPLPCDSRERVVLYALHQLGIMELRSPKLAQVADTASANSPVVNADATDVADEMPKFDKTILEFKFEKKPKYGTEMAAVIAYYLLVIVPKDQRKDTICRDDVIKYSQKADFKLPKSVKDILIHAEDAGYFAQVGDGCYQLTKIGFDFVKKELPRKPKK